jgi:hypothetical protein
VYLIRALVLILFGTLAAYQLHPFHVSVCDIEMNEKHGRLEITHKIFWDDLEEGLSAMAGKPVNVSKPKNEKELQELIEKYLYTHFSLKIDGHTVVPVYLGSELDEDAMWCYMEVENFTGFTTIEVKNTLLMEIFRDQMNLVHVKNRTKLKSLKLNTKTQSGTLKF